MKLLFTKTQIVIIGLGLLHCAAIHASAQMGMQKDALHGVTGISVAVRSLDSAVITDDQLRLQVELRLRRAGITLTECKAKICLPQFFVEVYGVQTSRNSDFKYCLLRAELNLLVAPVGEPDRRLIATVWTDYNSVLALLNDYGPVKDQIDEIVDQFANQYLAANPKPRG